MHESFFRIPIVIAICLTRMKFGHAQTTIPPIFKASPAVLSTLKGSVVPVLLPKRFAPATASDPLHIQVLSLTDSGYSLVLAADDQPCEGQHFCSWGRLEAGANSPVQGDLHSRAVRLTHGIVGRYAPFSCGANCSEADIVWHQGGFFYSISIKAGSKRELIRAANSAIADAPITKRTLKVSDTP